MPIQYVGLKLCSELCRHSEQRYREEYIDLKAIEPKISDLLSSARPNAIAQQLDKGRNEFRNSQVHIITEKISGWGITGIPEDKHLRGFGDDVCGRFLCPSTLDWEDPMYALNSSPLALVSS